MFFLLTFMLACQNDNPLPIFSESSPITIQAEAQKVRLKEVVEATKRTWLEGDKSQAQHIFKSYYVNEFRALIPQFQALAISNLAQVQYELGVFMIDIPKIEVPNKFENRLRSHTEQLSTLFDSVPVFFYNFNAKLHLYLEGYLNCFPIYFCFL